MSPTTKTRPLLGAGAAACAICCAPPVLALLGLASAGALTAIATITFVGLTVGLVLLAASILAVWAQKRRAAKSTCATSEEGPVEVTIGSPPSDRR